MGTFKIDGSYIFDTNRSAVAKFISEDIAKDFFNAYKEKKQNLTKTAEQERAEKIIKCFDEFNEFIEAGGTISQKSLMHFAIIQVLKENG